MAVASFHTGDDFLRIWYVSGSGNFAFVTYTCEQMVFSGLELAEAEQIVRSIAFGRRSEG